MKTVKFSELRGVQKRLVKAAGEAVMTAYCPYSGFAVGAALLTTGGRIITGSNVENAAYGSTICAERAALVRANAMGYRKIKAMAVVACNRKRAKNGVVAAPCGACRQMLHEAACLSGGDIEVILVGSGSSSSARRAIISSVTELLPMAFGPRSLRGR